MAKRKGDASRPEGGDDYEFQMPEFDEQAFMRREITSARSTFVTVAYAVVAGAVTYFVDQAAGSYRVGWLVILAAMLALAPLLRGLGFDEEATQTKAMIGNWFLLFFTALAVWILAYNIPL